MASVQICLYSLLQEFQLEEILMGIGNTVGHYVKTSEVTKQRKYTSYARICVYMNISKALLGVVMVEYQDEDQKQTLDYEHIPFHCRKCHEHVHLFKDCPLNKQAIKVIDTTQKDGFTTIIARKKNPPIKQIPDPMPKISTKNSYEILNQLLEEEEIQDPHKESQQGKEQNQTLSSSSPN